MDYFQQVRLIGQENPDAPDEPNCTNKAVTMSDEPKNPSRCMWCS